MTDQEKIRVLSKALESIAYRDIVSPVGTFGSNSALVQRYKDIAVEMQEEAMNALEALND